ncbi:MAG TPA: hypothetical protein VGP25_10905 [Gemmatimonadaceae bacterium]|jgi:hypothetical protein|nr:hypothetical protein [Gemmatimonadaceae bacterium]
MTGVAATIRLVALAGLVSAMLPTVPALAHAQAAAVPPAKTAKKPKEPKPLGETKVPRMFQAETPIALTFTANLRQLRRDKGATPPWRAATLAYADSAGKQIVVPLRARTRGIWRLRECSFPPLRLNFSGKETKHTLLDDLEKPKLVNFCKDNDQYEQYILQELQLYRIYQLLTPISHRVRLARVSYVDSASTKRDAERYAIIVEDPDELARRHSGTLLKTRGAAVSDFEAPQLALTYLFQYFVGNLDFSFSGLHNAELLLTGDGRLLPIAYDFDFSGAVNAAYATPPPNYNVRAVRIRKFLGPCGVSAEYPNALARFVEKKDAIYALYHDDVGKLMDPRVVKETLSYFDEFYDALRTPRDAARNVFDRCIGPA